MSNATQRVTLTEAEIADIGHGLSEWLDDAAPLNERRYVAAAEHSVAPRVEAIFSERMTAIRALADEWDRLADGNEAARGRSTKVAGYYRRHAALLRAALTAEVPA